MKFRFLPAAVLAFAAVLSSCATGGKSASADIAEGGAGISAKGAIGGMGAQAQPLWEGDGGAGLRIAVLAPEASGSGEDELWLPVYIQGLLNNNLRKYSAITIIDRQNLDKVIAEQDLARNGRFSDRDFVSIGNLTNAQYILAGTLQKLPVGLYSLQLAVTDTKSGIRQASFMQNGTWAALQSGTLVNAASADLLSQLGVNLTPYGKQALTSGDGAAARAEAGLARGIAAQNSGDATAALLNYSQAVAFDPGQMEAIAKLGSLSVSISGGSLSQRINNDIAARKAWLEAFKSAAAFYAEHPPFEITFDPALEQEGATDYKHETVDLAMAIALSPSESGWSALSALVAGLEKTGKRSTWGFDSLPFRDPTPSAKDAVVFGEKKSFAYKVEIALLNEYGKRIAASSVTLNTGPIYFVSGAKVISPPAGTLTKAKFPKINANDLTDTLTIVIVSVNGTPSQTLNSSGYMRIAAENFSQAQKSALSAPLSASKSAAPSAAGKLGASSGKTEDGNQFFFGVDICPLAGYSKKYGWEVVGLYPEIGYKFGTLRLSAFGGAGFAMPFSSSKPNHFWTYNAGGNLFVTLDYWFVGLGGGVGGAFNGGAYSRHFPFVRGSLGMGNFILFFDVNFSDSKEEEADYKVGLLYTWLKYL